MELQAIGPAFLIIPFLGYFLGPATAGIAVLVEGIMLLTQGERVGDRIAGTTVTKKSNNRSVLRNRGQSCDLRLRNQ